MYLPIFNNDDIEIVRFVTRHKDGSLTFVLSSTEIPDTQASDTQAIKFLEERFPALVGAQIDTGWDFGTARDIKGPRRVLTMVLKDANASKMVIKQIRDGLKSRKRQFGDFGFYV